MTMKCANCKKKITNIGQCSLCSKCFLSFTRVFKISYQNEPWEVTFYYEEGLLVDVFADSGEDTISVGDQDDDLIREIVTLASIKANIKVPPYFWYKSKKIHRGLI